MTDTTQEFKKQLPRNMFLQVLSFITNVAIGICLVPYLIGHLGRAAYGLIPLAGVMTQYVALVSYSISSAVARFLTIALQQDDVEKANSIFNTAFFSYLAIGLIQIPIFALVVHYANTIFSIPQELYRDTITLLICSAASFLINLVSSVFSVPMYANNRLDISRSLDIARQIIRLVGVVGMFVVWGPALRYVGYVDLLNTIALCTANIVIGKRLAPILTLARRYFDWRMIRELTGMGGWLLVNNIGALLFLRTDVWICNRFVHPEAAGDYAAILQWSNLIRSGGVIMSGLVAPMVMIYYARSEMTSLVSLCRLSTRVFTLVLAIPISLLCVFSSSILNLWLGESFARLWPLMVIMLSHLVINIGISPVFNVKNALNKVAVPGIVTMLSGLVNVFLAIVFVKYLGWGIYGVAIAGAVVLTAKNAFFMPIYGAFILRLPWHTFLKSYLSGSAFLMGMIVLELVVKRNIRLVSWAHLALLLLVVGIFGSALAWLTLSKRDQRLMINLIPVKIRMIIARMVQI